MLDRVPVDMIVPRIVMDLFRSSDGLKVDFSDGTSKDIPITGGSAGPVTAMTITINGGTNVSVLPNTLINVHIVGVPTGTPINWAGTGISVSDTLVDDLNTSCGVSSSPNYTVSTVNVGTANRSVTMTATVGTTVVGSYTVTIAAAAVDFQVYATNDMVIPQGDTQARTAIIGINNIVGLAGTVTVTVTTSPPTNPVQISPSSIQVSSSSPTANVSINLQSGAISGNSFTMNVSASNGTLTKTRSFQVTVTDSLSNFTLVPQNITIAQGSTNLVPATVSLANVSNINGSVTLTALVQGTITLNTTSYVLNANNNWTATLNIGAGPATTGSQQSVSLTAVGGGITRTGNIVATISNALADFTIVPSNITIAQGAVALVPAIVTLANVVGIAGNVTLTALVNGPITLGTTTYTLNAGNNWTATLNVGAGTGVNGSTYTIGLSASGSGVTKTGSVGVAMGVSQANFSVTANNTTIGQGATQPVTAVVSLSSVVDITGNVTLTATPSGGITLATTSYTLNAGNNWSASLSIGAGSAVTGTNASIAFSASGSGITRSGTMNVSVIASSASFTMATNNITIRAGDLTSLNVGTGVLVDHDSIANVFARFKAEYKPSSSVTFTQACVPTVVESGVHKAIGNWYKNTNGHLGTVESNDYWVNDLIGRMGTTITPYTGTYETVVQTIYMAVLGRPAEFAGVSYYAQSLGSLGAATDFSTLLGQYNANSSIRSTLDGFGLSPEWATLYGSMTTTQYIHALFQSMFGRQAEPTGLSYWLGVAPTLSNTGLALNILNSANVGTSAQHITDAATAAKKIEAAKLYTRQITKTGLRDAYGGNISSISARTLLTTVTANTNITGSGPGTWSDQCFTDLAKWFYDFLYENVFMVSMKALSPFNTLNLTLTGISASQPYTTDMAGKAEQVVADWTTHLGATGVNTAKYTELLMYWHSRRTRMYISGPLTLPAGGQYAIGVTMPNGLTEWQSIQNAIPTTLTDWTPITVTPGFSDYVQVGATYQLINNVVNAPVASVVSLSNVQGITGDITLTASPTGGISMSTTSYALNAANNYTATLNVGLGSAAIGANCNVALSASHAGTGVTRTGNIAVTIAQPTSNFSIIGPTILPAVTQGDATGVTTVDISLLSPTGFSSAALTVTPVGGLTITPLSATLTAANSWRATLSIKAGTATLAAAASYQVTVTGGTMTKSSTFSVLVNSPGLYDPVLAWTAQAGYPVGLSANEVSLDWDYGISVANLAPGVNTDLIFYGVMGSGVLDLGPQNTASTFYNPTARTWTWPATVGGGLHFDTDSLLWTLGRSSPSGQIDIRTAQAVSNFYCTYRDPVGAVRSSNTVALTVRSPFYMSGPAAQYDQWSVRLFSGVSSATNGLTFNFYAPKYAGRSIGWTWSWELGANLHTFGHNIGAGLTSVPFDYDTAFTDAMYQLCGNYTDYTFYAYSGGTVGGNNVVTGATRHARLGKVAFAADGNSNPATQPPIIFSKPLTGSPIQRLWVDQTGDLAAPTWLWNLNTDVVLNTGDSTQISDIYLSTLGTTLKFKSVNYDAALNMASPGGTWTAPLYAFMSGVYIQGPAAGTFNPYSLLETNVANSSEIKIAAQTVPWTNPHELTIPTSIFRQYFTNNPAIDRIGCLFLTGIVDSTKTKFIAIQHVSFTLLNR